MKNITIKDIAKKVGVSPSTVSRVMRGMPNVHPHTKKKVLKTAKKLGYFLDGSARAIVKKQTKTVGISVSDISNPFYPPLIRGIENTINKFGYSIILCNTDEDPVKEERYLRVMLEKRVDGLIISPTNSQVSLLKSFKVRGIPIVCIDRRLEDIDADTVTVDNVHGAFIAVEHLIKLGHKRIGIITGSREATTTQGRLKGYINALKQYKIDINKSLIVEGNSTIEGGIKATEALLKLKSPPTAIFSSNNLMTIGAYITLKRLKKNIPKDVAVIGFDDLEWAEALDPPLTAISQPTYTIGATAGQLLMQRLLNEGPREKQNIVLKTSLVVRKSC